MRAVGSKVLVQKLPTEKKTAGGLFLASPKEASTERGRVISAVDRYIDGGREFTTAFSAGDVIVYLSKTAIRIENTVDIYCCDMSSVLYVEEE